MMAFGMVGLDLAWLLRTCPEDVVVESAAVTLSSRPASAIGLEDCQALGE